MFFKLVSEQFVQVDLVTMLEKAISYVKFLQLQVKVMDSPKFFSVENELVWVFFCMRAGMHAS